MSLPVCISAKLLGIEIYLLEPNLTLGEQINFSKFFKNFMLLKKFEKFSIKI